MKISGMKCLMCGDTIVSKYRHDFVSCFCGNAFVDGGQEKVARFGAHFMDKFESATIETDDIEAVDFMKNFVHVIRDNSYSDKQREEAKAHILLLK
jgi:hypothetical protein